jgi:hypothetical protein
VCGPVNERKLTNLILEKNPNSPFPADILVPMFAKEKGI